MKGHTENLHPDLTKLLLELEHRVGIELNITSGYRDAIHNVTVGGVPDSEHIYEPAQAADVLCLQSSTRYKMLRELFYLGVKRIGIGATFLHVGIAFDKPSEVIWTYYDSTRPQSSTEI